MARFIVTADWDNNAPHLTAEAKAELYASIPDYQKDARTKGIPQLGAGVIYPIPEEDILVDAFAIPDHWPRGYGLDVGWNRTAAIWLAKNPDTGVKYLYDEHYRGEADPTVHGAAIRKRGLWIPGRIDPAARGRSQADGKKLIKLYRTAIYGEEDPMIGARMLGVAANAVETGIYDMLMALSSGLLKIMRHRCPNWLAERRLYRRNERGEIIKKNDHALDAGRYAHASGELWLAQKPAVHVPDPMERFAGRAWDGFGWMNA
ncbi:MAG TPA: hypothetical protein VMR92_08475 [Gemmatimonadales bacterium]|nr:hypothetical protein [Gemmatimonadales bacterium]